MSVPFSAKALFDYEAIETTELSVRTGENITVEEVNESGWCLARIDDRTGWLPTDYIERVDGVSVGAEVSRPQPGSQFNPVDEVPEPPPAPTPTAPATTYTQPAVNKWASASTTTSNTAAPANNTNSTSNWSKPAASTSSSSAASNAELDSTLNKLKISSGTSSNQPSIPSHTTKVCDFCHEPIKSAFVMAKEKTFHPNHFQCSTCSSELGGKAYLEKDGRFYCEDDYYAAFNPKCGSCREVIRGPYISAMEQCWHPEHFVCAVCQQPFPGNQFRKHENKPYCETHFAQLYAPKCAKCSLPINGQVFEALENKYHLDCFTCSFNDHAIGEGVMFHLHENKVYCPDHFESLFLQRCSQCKQAIKGQYIKIMDDHFHPEHWTCNNCNTILKPENCAQEGGKFYCKTCVEKGKVGAAGGGGGGAAPVTTNSHASSSNNSSAAPTDPFKIIDPKAAAALTKIQAAISEQAEVSATAPVFSDPSTSPSIDYPILKDKDLRPTSVDPAKKEMYLSAPEFQKLFKMEKAKFAALPEWRRNEAKKQLGLF